MSKKIVIEVSSEVAEALVLAAGTGAIVDQIVPQLQGKVERSVIEWHHPELVEEDGKQVWMDIPEWERCGASEQSEQVIAITKQGYVCAINVEFVEYVDDDGEWLSGVFPDGEDWEDYKAWAYLPEGGEDAD